jgi:thiol-disulfide isomerase/thioredoxin
MKKYIIFLVLFFAAISSIKAQTKINEKTVVKDGSGYVYPYPVWRKLLQSGDYTLKVDKTSKADNQEYFLYQMNDEEKKLASERKKSMLPQMSKPNASDVFKEGNKFKGEKFTAINGDKFDLRTSTGKIYILNFWFINCPPCKQEIPELNELVKKYESNKDVVFIGIALDSSSELKEFLKTNPFNYNIVDDGDYYAKKYGVRYYPTHVIIGKDDLIKFSTVGLASNTVYWLDKVIAEQVNSKL